MSGAAAAAAGPATAQAARAVTDVAILRRA
jgi:hypothetical protein